MTKDQEARGAKFSEFASVGRATAILELLSSQREGVSVTEIATELALTKTTAFRILASLKSSGYVTQDSATSRYLLTYKLVTLAYRHLATVELSDICLPTLRRVAQHTSQLVRLAVFDDDELRWIAQVQGAVGRVRLHAELGYPVALHASASGKAWLSTLAPEQALRIALARGLEQRTPRTITTADELLADLREVRSRGYALALEEGDLGVVAIAVPVRAPEDGSGAEAVGTLSVSGLTLNLDRSKLESFLPEMQAAAAELSQFWLGRYDSSPGTLANVGAAGDLAHSSATD